MYSVKRIVGEANNPNTDSRRQFGSIFGLEITMDGLKKSYYVKASQKPNDW